MDIRDYRDALGRFATGVCVVTARDASFGDVAMTVNSFSALSLKPPMVLWSIQKSSECFVAFTTSEWFGVSVLSTKQEHLSVRYAKSSAEGIDGSDFVRDEKQVLLVDEALATFSCELSSVHSGGDHQIIIGQVKKYSCQVGLPLVFFGGQYRSLSV